MTRHLRTAPLIIAFSLLTSAGTVQADVAWELWLRKDYDAGLVGRWRVVAAFKSRQDCMTAMQRRFMEVSGGQPLTTRDAQRGRFLFVVPDGSAATAAKCVPDTVDPRGATGKRATSAD